MSLVAYDSSGDSGSEEDSETITATTVISAKPSSDSLVSQFRSPDKNDEKLSEFADLDIDRSGKIHFEDLPKPRSVANDELDIEDEDDYLPPKNQQIRAEKTTKKEKGPVKITFPALSEFKDIEEEDEKKRNRLKPSEKGTGLVALLPPPKGQTTGSKRLLIPQVLTKKPVESASSNGVRKKVPNASVSSSRSTVVREAASSEDEDDGREEKSELSFFSLPESHKKEASSGDFFSLVDNSIQVVPPVVEELPTTTTGLPHDPPAKTLVSNVINLPRDEILLKNKAEVGPKLPVPEQEYNVDPEGNVAFDEKAIEYLCGKRGVKRKGELDEANIIEINGEDIKPDEREWMVKALTQETVTRPVSMHGAGPSSQSKKKHQITYLAHQAKAMEVELKNQWAQNRMTRKQTQSKYGF